MTSPTSRARWRATASTGRLTTASVTDNTAAAAAPRRHRAAGSGALSTRGRPGDQHDEQAEVDGRAGDEQPPLAAAEGVAALELGLAEVGSRLDGDRLRAPVARTQEQDRGLGDDDGGHEGDRQAQAPPHRRDSTQPAPRLRPRMRVAICSDIHGNRHAFEAVIAAAEADGAEELWCLGDLVGYGAEPDACVALAEAHCAVCLAGNHDLAVIGVLSLADFSRGAALAAEWTQETIAPEHRDFLRGLEPKGEAEGIGLYHASPRDPVWEYVLSDADRRAVPRRHRRTGSR